MASKKKSTQAKQSRSSGNPSSYSQLYKGDSSGVTQAKSSAKPAQATTAAAVSENINWQEEYGYVFSDIRTLLIVTVALFAGILAIGFFL